MITETILRNALFHVCAVVRQRSGGWRVKFEAPLIYVLETGVHAA